MTVHDTRFSSMAHRGAIQVSSPRWPPHTYVPASTTPDLVRLLGILLGLDDVLLCRMTFEDPGHYLYRDPTDGLIYLERRASAPLGLDARPVVALRRPARRTEDMVLPHTLYTRSFRDPHDMWMGDHEACEALRCLARTGVYPEGYGLGAPVGLTFRGDAFGS